MNAKILLGPIEEASEWTVLKKKQRNFPWINPNCYEISLQLVVKHSFELQESLQEGLDQTPSQCWRAIIPQLFSRLNHPVKVVRNRISDLLCRIAEGKSFYFFFHLAADISFFRILIIYSLIANLFLCEAGCMITLLREIDYS